MTMMTLLFMMMMTLKSHGLDNHDDKSVNEGKDNSNDDYDDGIVDNDDDYDFDDW